MAQVTQLSPMGFPMAKRSAFVAKSPAAIIVVKIFKSLGRITSFNSLGRITNFKSLGK